VQGDIERREVCSEGYESNAVSPPATLHGRVDFNLGDDLGFDGCVGHRLAAVE
jgi:hypothetical protein